MNCKNKFKNLSVFFILFSFGGVCFSASKIVVAQDLSLHKFLTNIKHLVEQQDGKEGVLPGEKLGGNLFSTKDEVYGVLCEELGLIESLVEHFNSKNLFYNPEIEFTFFLLCNYLDQFLYHHR